MIARLLRAAASLLGYFCVATILAQIIVLVYLTLTWQLDRDKVVQIMAIAQGIAVGAIVCNSDGVEFHKPLEEPKAIGKTIEDVRRHVAGNYGNVGYICPRFAQGLLDNSEEVIGHLKNGNKLLQQLDRKAIQDALTVASLLLPYLKRIKKDNKGSK